MGFLIGVFHPPPQTDPNYWGCLYREDEVKHLEELYPGKPVYVEHNVNNGPVGKIIRIYPTVIGPLLALIEVDESIELGRTVWKQIESGKMMGLSFGCGMDSHGDIVVSLIETIR